MGQNAVCGAILKQTQETHRQHPPPVCCKLFFPPHRHLQLKNFSRRHAHFPLQQHRRRIKVTFLPLRKSITRARVSHAKKYTGKDITFPPSQLGNWGTSKKNNRDLKRVSAFLLFFWETRVIARALFFLLRVSVWLEQFEKGFFGDDRSLPVFFAAEKKKIIIITLACKKLGGEHQVKIRRYFHSCCVFQDSSLEAARFPPTEKNR